DVHRRRVGARRPRGSEPTLDDPGVHRTVGARELLLEEALDLAADAIRRERGAEAREDAPPHAHLAVLADREREVVDGLVRGAALLPLDLDVEEAAREVEG